LAGFPDLADCHFWHTQVAAKRARDLAMWQATGDFRCCAWRVARTISTMNKPGADSLPSSPG